MNSPFQQKKNKKQRSTHSIIIHIQMQPTVIIQTIHKRTTIFLAPKKRDQTVNKN